MTPAAAGPRVVSLLPSVSETLRAWRLDPVACTRFCEQPDLPHVGGTKDPDVTSILALVPDLVVLDEEENRLEDAEALTAAGIPLLVTAVRSVADVAPTLRRLAEALDLPYSEAPATPEPEIPTGEADRLRAFVPIWRRPWMTINSGTYGSSVLEEIGIDNVYAGDQERYPTVDLAGAAARNPDRVLAPSEPYPFSERHRTELEGVAPVELVDGRDLFWWGVRTPAALIRLATALAPRFPRAPPTVE